MSILRRYMQSVRGDIILHFQRTQMIHEENKIANMEKLVIDEQMKNIGVLIELFLQLS